MVAKHSQWHDEFWLMIMQLYLRKPVGVKPRYCRATVDLSLELHISPVRIFERMCTLANLETPRVEHLWEQYGNNPSKLSRMVKRFREMKGFNNAEAFYKDVEVNETFEKDFKPIDDLYGMLTPMMLILVLDLYFRLTPITMVAETPEVIALARMMKINVSVVVESMEIFQHCDPYLHRDDIMISPLLLPCQRIWQRYGNRTIEEVSKLAGELKEYFR